MSFITLDHCYRVGFWFSSFFHEVISSDTALDSLWISAFMDMCFTLFSFRHCRRSILLETKFEDYGGKYRPSYAVAKIKSETKSVFTSNSA